MPKGRGASATQILGKLGLNENEAGLYTLLLRYPESTVQSLATHSPLPRTMLYHVLNQLAVRGLVSAAKDKWRTTYSAENPERLYDLLAREEQEFATNKEAIAALIPELKERYRLAGQRPGVRIFEGLAEYQKALDDILLSAPRTVYAYADVSAKHPGLEMRAAYAGKRVGRKILQKTLLPDTPDARKAVKKIPYNDYTQYRLAKRIDTAVFDRDFQLYAGKIFSTSYHARHPIVILLEDEQLYNMQMALFNLIWTAAEDVTLSSIKKTV